ncbi:MAG: heme-binding domain-containing protein [Anaerolineales bacterium]|nr:heme-binding domain-containing protein [Anaerolineales bacterium]
MKKILKLVVIVVVIGLVVLALSQLIVAPLKTNPLVVSEPKWDSPQTRALAKRACFDCHSNETVWPWYSNVPPISWLVVSDTVRGRARLNFSEWGQGRVGAGEISEVIQEGEMPPAIYLPMHPNARLSNLEKQQLINGLSLSLGQ